MTSKPLASEACTILPGSTSRNPTRPVMGDVMWAVDQIQLGAVDLRLIGLDGSLILRDQRLLGVELLLRNRVLLHQGVVAFQIEVRVLEQRLIVDELAFGLLQLHFIRPRIDLHQQVALVHDLPFFEQHLHQLAVHAALDGDGVDGRYSAQARYVDFDVAFRGPRRHHLRRPPPAPRRPAAFAVPLRWRVAAGQKRLELRPLPIADPPAKPEGPATRSIPSGRVAGAA